MKYTNLIFLTFTKLSVAQTIGPWQRVFYTGASISGRYSMATAYLPQTNEFLIYGGISAPYVNDFYSINLTSRTSLRILGQSPTGNRGWFASDTDYISGSMFVFGGYDGGSESNDLLRLNYQSRSWTKLSAVDGPSPRLASCLVFDEANNRLIVFGGGFAQVNDLWIYSISTDQWETEIPLSETIIPGRTSHACTIRKSDSALFVHGGIRNFQDLWQYDFGPKQWILIDGGNTSVNLHGHKMKYSQSFNSLFLFFGDTGTPDEYSSKIYKYSFSSPANGWTVVIVGLEPPQRARFSAGFNPFTGEYYIFGGEYYWNDLWKITIDAPETSVESSVSIPPTAQTSQVISSIATDTGTGTASYSESAPASQTFSSSAVFKLTLSFQHLYTTSSSKTIVKIAVGEPPTSFLQMFFGNTMFITILGIVVFVSCIVCIWCTMFSRRRKRMKLEKQKHTNSRQSFPPTITNSSSTTYMTNHTRFTENEVSSSSYSGSSDRSSNATSMRTTHSSYTVVSNDLGISVPGYLMINYPRELRIRSVLAQGGFGVAYIADAFSKNLSQYGPEVVVKQIRKSELSEKDIETFNQEVALMEYFKGRRNIAKILGFSNNPYCIVMKYYALGSLAGWIKRKNSDLDPSLQRSKSLLINFVKDIGCGVMAIQEKGVTHNDLKPDNILIDIDNNIPFCVLSDFGISQIMTEEIITVKQFRIAVIRGMSLAYAAPERILNVKGQLLLTGMDVVFTWDVYSLSLIIFQLLTRENRIYTA